MSKLVDYKEPHTKAMYPASVRRSGGPYNIPDSRENEAWFYTNGASITVVTSVPVGDGHVAGQVDIPLRVLKQIVTAMEKKS